MFLGEPCLFAHLPNLSPFRFIFFFGSIAVFGAYFFCFSHIQESALLYPTINSRKIHPPFYECIITFCKQSSYRPFRPRNFRQMVAERARIHPCFLNKMLNIAVVCEFVLQALDFFWKCGTIHLALKGNECQTVVAFQYHVDYFT